MKKRLFALILAVVLIFSAFPIQALAASYPLVTYTSWTSTPVIPSGEVGYLKFSVWHEFNNEKLQVRMYDSDGDLVASSTSNMYASSYSTEVTISINTNSLGLSVGEYTIEYWMEFYSLYQWNTAPRRYEATVTVVNNVCRGNHSLVQDWVYDDPTCEEDGGAVYKCTRCGYKTSKTIAGSHDYSSSITMPTETTNGYTTFTCNTCGYSYTENYIFPDVRSDAWYYDAVEFAARKGYFSGYQSGMFGPADNISRQDFVLVLARIDGVDLTAYTGRTNFKDVVADSYYEAAVNWAYTEGITTGYNPTEFGVGDQITREQLVTMLYRYAIKKGYDVSVAEDSEEKLNTFSDANRVSPFATEACVWAIDKGVIKGMTATTVGPQGNASRAHAAQILKNISDNNVLPF